jgi:hypothetical protein
MLYVEKKEIPNLKKYIEQSPRDQESNPGRAIAWINKNWIVQRPGAIRSEVGTADMKFVP